MAKWDVKDDFWQMCSKVGEEWIFTYMLPQPEGEPTLLIIPMTLQMGWVESPPLIFAALETARDITTDFGNTKIRSLQVQNSLITQEGMKSHRGSLQHLSQEHSSYNTALRYMLMTL